MTSPGDVARAQVAQRDGKLGFVYKAALEGYSAAGLSREDVEALRRDPRVKYVEPNRRVELAAQTIPTGVKRIFAPDNEALDIDGQDDVRVNVDVAVIDSGIDFEHPDLNVFQRTDCVGVAKCVNGAGTDGYYHGTHVAGTIGAIDNGEGIVGVAPGARLWSVRVFDDEGNGNSAWTLAGINWVTERAGQIEVSNMSLAGTGVSLAQEEAIQKSVEAGVVNTAAAGNQSLNADSRYPANGPDVITVAAMADYNGTPGGGGSPTCGNHGADDTHADFSNWGSAVELTGPGACIYSTLPGGKYGASYGTSFSTPHVSGAAAILASQANPANEGDVVAIRNSLIERGSLDWNDTSEDGKPEPLLDVDDQPLTAPEAATGGWTTVGGGAAKLFGAVNARGLEATYRFEYGTTTEYGRSAPFPEAVVGASAGYTPVSHSIGGLKSNQTYHYRLVMTTEAGTVYGRDRTFTTPRWTVQSPLGEPATTAQEWLEDISCPAAGSCMAVGPYDQSNRRIGSYKLAFGKWQFVAMPTPVGGSNPGVNGVSCTAITACTAVGNVTINGNIVPLVERWNGSAWSTQAIAPPYSNAPYSVLTDVSCASSSSCLAVGYFKDPQGVWVNYSARWSGGAWTTLTTPNPSNFETQSLLESVSCASASSCVAVGRYHQIGGSERPVNAVWNGSSWSLQPSARTSGFSYGVACPVTNACVAVGGWTHSETWDGSSWSSHKVTFPAGASGYFHDLSCVSTSYCVAVGTLWKGARASGLVSVWDGTSWKAQTTPREAEANHQLFGVACVSASGCHGVGTAQERFYDSLIVSRGDAVTDEATEVEPSRAVLTGAVYPGGLATSYRFEYGKTASYGKAAPVPSAEAGSGLDGVDVSQQIEELEAETDYHYRLAATNANGTAYGEDRTFRTAAVTPQYVSSFGVKGFANGQFNLTKGVAIDASGNVWVTDNLNNRVQKFSPGGEYLMQFGTAGSGNGQFKGPNDIAITPGGDLWVTDGGNNRVQKFNANGQYLAQFGSSGPGNGQFGEPTGIAIAPDGHIWVADAGYSRVQEFTAAGTFIQKIGGSEWGTAPGQLFAPHGVAVDAGNHVWVADSRNHRIQKFSPSGAYLGHFGTHGTGDGQFNEPYGIEVKPSGSLVVADRRNGRVQQFSPRGDFETKLGSKGTGTAQLREPHAVAIGPAGAIYVADTYNNRVQRWRQPTAVVETGNATAIGETTTTLDGTINPGGATTTYRFEYGATTSYGASVPVPDGAAGEGMTAVSVGEQLSGLQPETTYHYRLAAFNDNGAVYGPDRTFKTKAYTPKYVSAFGGKGSGNGQLISPRGIAVDAGGNVWVADTGNNRVQKFSPGGEYLMQFGTLGTGNGQFKEPMGIAVTPAGDIWVADSGNDRVQRFNASGQYLGQFGSSGSGNGQFAEPGGVAIAPDGHIWVADSNYFHVQEFTAAGAFIQRIGSSFGSAPGQLFSPNDLVVDAENHLWVADTRNHRIQEFSPAGAYLSQFGTYGAGDGQFDETYSVDLDPQERLLVVDRRNGRVERFSRDGEFETQFATEGSGTGQLREPRGIAAGADGTIYIADTLNNRVQKWK